MFLTLFSSCALSRKSADRIYHEGLKQQPYDAIIVPGYPYDGDGWNMVLEIRILWANYLYKNGYTKNIIFSGSAVYTKYYESRVMADYAAAFGIPREHLFTEERAEHSVENIYYSYRLAKEHGFKNIALATDPNQTKNVRQFISKYELPIKLLPIVFDTLEHLSHVEPKIDASDDIKENFVSIEERQGFFTRLHGTFGSHIMWNEEDLKKKKFIRKYEKRKAHEQQ